MSDELTREEERFLWSAIALIVCLIGTTICGIVACIYKCFN
jgi:high-affinity K+ transport system ATPase subunit B